MTEIDATNAFLRQADARCALHEHRLTPLRRHILALLLHRGGRATAYQLLDDMQAAGANGAGARAPITIYRALHFLMRCGLVSVVHYETLQRTKRTPRARLTSSWTAKKQKSRGCASPARALGQLSYHARNAVMNVAKKRHAVSFQLAML
jgi:hypothetical protein